MSSYDFVDSGPFPAQSSAHRDPFSFGNLRKKKTNRGDDEFGEDDEKDVSLPQSTAANSMNFNELSRLRDRGRYGGFDSLDTAPVIPMLETPVNAFGKKNSNTDYRKAKTSQKKQMLNSIAKMNNSYQHNHALLNPIGGPGVNPNGGPRAMSLANSQNGMNGAIPPGPSMPAGPRSMSFNTNGPPRGDPRAMSLQSGRLPPFAPKQRFGPGPNPMAGGPNPMAGPPRNGSMGNVQNPYGPPRNVYGGPPRNGSLTNMQNPYGGGGPPRNGSMNNMQNPYGGPPRNGSMNNVQNPYGAPPRNGSMNNVQSPYGGIPSGGPPRNGSMNNMQNPMGLRNGSMTNVQNPMGVRNGSMTNVQNPMAARNGSMTNIPNPYGGGSPRNGSMTNMQNPMPRNGSMTNVQNPIAQRPQTPPQKSQRSTSNKGSPLKTKDSPLPPPPPEKSAESPLRKGSSPRRNNAETRQKEQHTPDTPDRRYASQSPRKIPQSDRQEREDRGGNDRGKLRDFLMDDSFDELENPYDSLKYSSKSKKSAPKSSESSRKARSSVKYKSNRISMDPMNASTKVYDYSDNYLDDIPDESNADDPKREIVEEPKYSSESRIPRNSPKSVKEEKPKSNMFNRFNDSGSEDEGIDVFQTGKSTPFKKSTKKKPPTAFYDEDDDDDFNLSSKPALSKESKNTSKQHSSMEKKKSNFMAKLEASIDDTIGTTTSNNNLPVATNNGYDYSSRMSRSNFKTILSPDLNTDNNGTFGDAFQNQPKPLDEKPTKTEDLSSNSNSFSNTDGKISSTSTFDGGNNTNNSSHNNSNRNSGIAGGFLKKLGLKKSNSSKEKRKSKRESKLLGSSSRISGIESKKVSETTLNDDLNQKSRNNTFDDDYLKGSDTSYNHNIYNLEEEKKQLFSKPSKEQPKEKSENRPPWSSPVSDDLNEPSSFANPVRDQSYGNDFKKGLPTLSPGLGVSSANDSVNEKSFRDTLNGAFDDIGAKLDGELLRKDASENKQDELAAKAEVESEYLKMTGNKPRTLSETFEERARYDLNGSSSTAATATANGKEKIMISSGNRLNLSVEQMGIIEANQSLINELQLMTKELTDSIQREVKLENDLRNYKLNLNSTKVSPSISNLTADIEKLESELREKSLSISKLMIDFNEERKYRKIAEEHVLIWESQNNIVPSFLDLSYENSRLQSQMIDKQEQINQQQQLIFQFDSEKKGLEQKYAHISEENHNYKNKVIPDLTNQIEILRNTEYQLSKKYQEQLTNLKEKNQDLQLKVRNYETGVLRSPAENSLAGGNAELEDQRDAFREALKSLKDSKERESREASEKISALESKVKKLTHLNEKLQEKLLG